MTRLGSPRFSGMNRRNFLGRCGGCAMAAACGGLGAVKAFGQQPATGETRRPRIRLVFSHIPRGTPTWPHNDYDYDARKAELLAKLQQACPDIEFVPTTVMKKEDTEALLADDAGVDGYLLYLLGLWTHSGQLIAATGKPTLLVDDLYAGSGEFLIENAALLRQGRNAAGVSSSRFSDVVAAARCFQGVQDPAVAAQFGVSCRAVVTSMYAAPGDLSLTAADAPPPCDLDGTLSILRDTAILLVGRPAGAFDQAITATVGTRVIPLGFAELDAAYRAADPDEAKAVADGWKQTARAVVEPDRDTLVRSSAMQLGMNSLLKQHNARAIAINCLGGFYGQHMEAYPCLGFTQLNDEGKVGACEADLESTLTMLLVGTLAGRPGFISDPVIDTSCNQIIYAHCVAPTKVYGPAGPANPFDIRSHSEDRNGASLRSLMPLGRMTTSLEVDPVKKQILFHQAKTVANVDEDKACRTKLAAEVKGDIEKLLTLWDQWGWHRVTFYGDLTQPVNALADRLGFEVVQEA